MQRRYTTTDDITAGGIITANEVAVSEITANGIATTSEVMANEVFADDATAKAYYGR